MTPRITVLGMLAVIIAMMIACSEDVYFGTETENKQPLIYLTNGPVDGEQTDYNVHFFWFGYDPDGIIDHYEYVLVTGDPIGFDPDDTTGIDKWTKSKITDIKIKASADVYDTTVTIYDRPYSRYAKTHTFFVRAVDNRGMRSPSAHRSFTAWTLAPYVNIVQPRNPNPGFGQVLNPRITFVWRASDPIDAPWNTQDADSVRFLYKEYTPYLVDQLNRDPEQFENIWSNWIAYDAPGDSGRTTILGDDEILELGKTYIFALQAKDEVGAVTSIFDYYTNVRRFLVMQPPGPLLLIRETYLGLMKFIGKTLKPARYTLPQGFPLNFHWWGDPGEYGSEIATYRYGWDISDLSNPDEWEVTAGPQYRSAPTKKFYSGTHTLYVEVKDSFGLVTLGQVEITIFPATMDRNLLLVDDFNSDNFPQMIYAMPTEDEHDQFWNNICSRVHNYDPAVDVYDTRESNWQVPPIELVWRYKNVIWVYTSEDRTADNEGTIWIELCEFTPESWIGPDTELRLNYLPYFLESGGHLWTLGKSDREGGFGGLLPGWSRQFPVNLKCEMTGPRSGCSGDTSGVNSLAYRDYCVTIIDKVWGRWRPELLYNQIRDVDIDAMVYGYRDDNDVFTVLHPGLPKRLSLWEEVLKPGRFFDPSVRGFTYVEIYDPLYWMQQTGVYRQRCSHPMYRMRSRNTRSVIDDAAVAVWTTKYADVVGNAPGCVAAPSVQFGFPLWFFERAAADSIADVILKEWHIHVDQH